MKNQKVLDSVLDFIKNNPGCSVEAIVVGTKNSDILARGAIKALQTDGVIVADQDTGAYSFNAEGKSKQVVDDKKTQPKSDKKKSDDELGPKTVYPGRDNSKYDFSDQKGLGKSRLVLAVIRQYILDNPKSSIAKIQEVFDSKTVQPRYGVLESFDAGKKHTKSGRERYFFKPEDVLKVGSQKAVVTNQWTAERLQLFLACAKKLGYKISVSK